MHDVLKFVAPGASSVRLPRMDPTEVAEVFAKAEPVRRQPAPDEPPPPYPVSFGAAFVPPAHCTKLLQTLHRTPRDERIVFHELPHVYVVDARFAYDTSVTTLVKAHTEDFNAGLCIERMRRSRREAWPRKKYAVDPTLVSSVAEAPPSGLLLVVVQQTDVTVAAIDLTSSGVETQVDAAIARARENIPEATCELYATPRAMVDDEILAMWDENRVDAANRGTWIHWNLELWSNSLPCCVDNELLHGLRFVGDVLRPMGVRAWATEMEIFSEAEEIAGSIDWIGEDEDGRLVIVDWKRSKKLDTELVSGYRKLMSKPLSHLHDCDGCKYALQLSLYAQVLEKHYGKTIRALVLCCVHEEHPIHTFVPYLKLEADYLLSKRRREVAARTRVDVEDVVDGGTLPRCTLTRRILFDGVWVTDDDGGRILCNRKDAMVRFPNADLVDATELTSEVRRRIDAVQYETWPERDALETCTPWERLMPMDGLATPPQI